MNLEQINKEYSVKERWLIDAIRTGQIDKAEFMMEIEALDLWKKAQLSISTEEKK